MLGFPTEWEGHFRRYADGKHTGECSIRDFINNVILFVIMGVYRGIGTCGKYRDRCGDQ